MRDSDAVPRRPHSLPGSFLARVDPTTAADLLDMGQPRDFGPGDDLTHQGDPQTEVFLLQSARVEVTACVKVTLRARNGSETLLAIRATGDLVGECAALRDERTRAATVTACAHTVAHVIDNKRFAAYLDGHPAVWRPLAERLVNQLDWANRRQLDFAGYDARVRLARVILELADLYGDATELGVNLGIRISQEEWGRLIGARPDTARAALRQLRGSGVVSMWYRGLRITDVDGLRDQADED